MKRRILIAAGWLALILFVSTVDTNGQAPPNVASPSPSPSPIEVMYTGRLLGYFRTPSLQKRNDEGCPAGDPSYPAKVFLDQRQKNSAILVGMGDNFAPHLEARVFSDPAIQNNKYQARNKELYFGKEHGWEFYKDLKEGSPLDLKLQAGHGTIPSDNVACFLRAAKFAAVVPGKHDFYFGAERLRQFARFLAAKADADGKYKPVQMLGANLVLKTVPINGANEAVKQSDVGEWPDDEYAITNLREGQTVYPWFSNIKIEVEKVGDQKSKKDVFLCKSLGGPNQMPTDFSTCKLLGILDPSHTDGPIELKLPHLTQDDLKPDDLKNVKGNHFSTLLPATNYGICIEQKIEKKQQMACLRFSSHTPFFYFPHPIPKEKETEDGYTDPEPFVVVDDRVAIFGVVDPTLGEQVGILNFGWRNKQGNLTTRVSVEDPAEALQQQLEYFEELKPGFKGLKILLAQMSPERARALASKFPKFQIVVAGAGKEQSTSEVEMSTVWDSTRHPRAFMAVPAPYFDTADAPGMVYFGTIQASESSGKWALKTPDPTAAEYIKPVKIEPLGKEPATEFWTKIEDELQRCLPADFGKASADKREYLQWFVLCAMRKHTNADIALIQKRDVFDQIPDLVQAKERMLTRAKAGQSEDELKKHIQQTLDGLIWKGDLITLLYVPGSDLKKALIQSETYDAEETSSLSLVIDRGRQLETLGVRKAGGEYFINDLPLDEKKVYSVATTDYIGAGDTGYPDLAKAALNPRTHPAAFPEKLIPISSLVCYRLFPQKAEAAKYCLDPVKSDQYLDQTTAQRIPPYKQPSVFKRAWDGLGLEWPDSASEATTIKDAIEQTVQRRQIWRLSLQNFSFGFKSLDNNHSETELKEKFEGVPLSGVTATETEAFNFDLNTRLTRSSHKREFFIGSGLEYERLSTADDPDEFQISQIKNRLFEEIGLVFWRTPGRSLPNLGMNVSLYTETQLERPFSVFTLATKDKKRIEQDRSWLLLPRLGIRWQTRANSAEIGVQAGREIHALRGYEFNTGGVVVKCVADSGKSFSKCIEENSDPAKGGSITKDSEAKALLPNRPRMGIYWKTALSLPFTSRVKYELEDTGDFFFVNFRGDTSVDTRFRSISKHRLGFVIWPSVSIGPTLELLLYQNKVNRDFLFQRQFGIETKISFDIFNRRETFVQLKGKK